MDATLSTIQARVTVTVQIVALIPWLDEAITSTATAPVERDDEPPVSSRLSEGSGGAN